MPSALPPGDPAPRDGRLPHGIVDSAGGVPFGVYVHVPFCRTRCGYCDFNTYTASELSGGVTTGTYTDTLLQEVKLATDVLAAEDVIGEQIPPVSSIFFGGGTPTLLPAEHLGLIIRAIGENFGLTGDVEITTEANPETVTPAYLSRLREAGFTRISLGMQSAVPKVLEVLDREHEPGRPLEAVAEAKAAGFEHINLDLIYGTPNETDADWVRSLEVAVSAKPDHISAYALVVEEGTALARQVAAGVVPMPEDDVLADRYVIADDILSGAGMQWYEVSNWARSDAARCRHNELYWRDGNWWGFGPGAHSHVGAVRWWNVKHPARYAALLDSGESPAAAREVLDDEQRYSEKIMLGVRLRDGLAIDELPERARYAVPQLARWGLIEQGFVGAGRLVLTQRGRLLADAVVRELLG